MKGKTLRGKPYATVVRGQVVMKEGKIQDGVFPFK
jgi:dihydroorotase-like cyclic amidohydrolase